ncbi:outer membrane beta-barrel protein [Chitinophaga nivalis]|uniref:Outer membrane beta-barrel protein n=1 Tax=Chitinophaga nivalis TaxID=2991709 RepID=A0ABT3ILH4_9BACT|nr:outer membrane beta-barrel protein [Chitinophaga nivalis]MCW3465489.1 outer membrane beta-barrel protein [Chitinophaga nivalis]MCW3484820.1 outer membrane beta-barrel protein [Chitinophaga nivalis]
MKIPHLLSAATLALAITGSVHAQDKSGVAPHSKFYLKVAGGYFFSVFPGQYPNVGPYPPQDLRTEFTPGRPLDTLSRKILTGSYGEGVRGGLTFGYNINKYLAVEGTFNYFSSRKNLMTRSLATVAGSGKVLGSVESNGHVNAIDFAPSLVVSPGYEKVNPYVRIGVVVPLWGHLTIETEATQLSAPPAGLPVPPGAMVLTNISRKEQIKPNPTIGVQGALGVAFTVSPRFGVFVEAEYRNVPVRSKEKEITAYTETNTLVNGATGATIQALPGRNLDNLSVAEKNTKYVTTLDKGSNTEVGKKGAQTLYKNNNEPSNDLKSYINVGGLGLNAGIKFRL